MILRFLILCVFLLTCGFEVQAQSSYYLSKDRNENEGVKNNSPKIFLPSTKASGVSGTNIPSVAEQNLVQERKLLQSIEAAQKVDLRLLTSLGSGPQTAQELIAVATAHKAKKVLAVMEQQAARKKAFVAQQMGQNVQAPAARPVNSTRTQTIKSNPGYIGGADIKKPPKVFKDY